MRTELTALAFFIYLTSYLCTSQSIGRRINQFNPQWHCNVDSFEFTRTDHNDCDKAIDSNDNTFWHTKYTPSDAALPHRITIDMGKVYNTRSMTYLPRQDGDSNGNIGNWRISLSADEEMYRLLNGSWKDDSARKTVDFLFATPARYLRLDALTEAGGRGPWSSVAQIDVYEDNGSDNRNPPSSPNASPLRNASSSLPATGRQTSAPFKNSTITTHTASTTVTTTETATSTPSSSGDTATSVQLNPATSSGAAVSAGAPAGSSDAVLEKAPGFGMIMVALATVLGIGLPVF
ncbi:MAG: hypothetical protein Q9208_007853 [Pyrenodesmia sp. 3 TL-2023]